MRTEQSKVPPYPSPFHAYPLPSPLLFRLLLPPMGHEERAELSKMASIYKIRCRYGKSTQVASSTLMKARYGSTCSLSGINRIACWSRVYGTIVFSLLRQTCIPGHGEVDAILDGFARSQNLK